MNLGELLREPGFVDWLNAVGTLIAVLVALVALYQVQRGRRWEDRTLLIDKVYSPLHKALTADRYLIETLNLGWFTYLRGKELAGTLRSDGLWERIPNSLRRDSMRFTVRLTMVAETWMLCSIWTMW